MSHAEGSVEVAVSPSVRRVRSHFEANEPISTAALATAILQLHEKYAGGKAAAVELDERRTDSTNRTAEEWLHEVRLLFD